MRFLLTNDDGIDAPGLDALATAAERIFDEVWIVAPAEQASQIGHRVTTDEPLRAVEHGTRRFSVAGTPADCSRVALKHLLPREPDWVFSGVNHGGNLGRHDFAISGTVAAVREAAFHGVRGVAFSHYLRRDRDMRWEAVATEVARVFSRIADEELDSGEFWNVNFPHVGPQERSPDVVFCEQERQPLEVIFEPSDCGGLHYRGRYHERPREADTDVAVCFGGDIAVSRVTI